MKNVLLPLIAIATVLSACERQYEQNPDPNHTHADFAVWVDGTKVDFSDDRYMSGLSTDDATHDEEHEYLHQYLHLHDGIGHVIHSHKPGMKLSEFFDSLGYTFPGPKETWKMWVNEAEVEFNLDYAFQDMDRILLTNSAGSAEVLSQVEQLTEDACLYSRTCPWRGEPPAENCISDPAVPCVEP